MDRPVIGVYKTSGLNKFDNGIKRSFTLFTKVDFQEKILSTAAFQKSLRFKIFINGSIVGSVVECSPATRAARVRFPDDAYTFFPFQALRLDKSLISVKNMPEAVLA